MNKHESSTITNPACVTLRISSTCINLIDSSTSVNQTRGRASQRWLTEQTNRTEHFRGRVRFVRVRRHIEQNRTIPLFGSCSAGFRTLIPVFGSVRLELEPNSTLVRFVFGKFELLKAKSSTVFLGVGIVDCWSNSWIGKSKQWPRNNGRGTMVGRTMAGHWVPQIQRHRH